MFERLQGLGYFSNTFTWKCCYLAELSSRCSMNCCENSRPYNMLLRLRKQQKDVKLTKLKMLKWCFGGILSGGNAWTHLVSFLRLWSGYHKNIWIQLIHAVWRVVLSNTMRDETFTYAFWYHLLWTSWRANDSYKVCNKAGYFNR